MEELQRLEKAIEEAEQLKRDFVKNNPNGSGDKSERNRLYSLVEKSRKALRDFKLKNHDRL